MTNPLPNHAGPNVNAIIEASGVGIKTKLYEIKSPMDVVYKVMVKIGVIPKIKIFEGKCYYCQKACLSHTIGKYERFKALLQRMMDHGEIEIFRKDNEKINQCDY